MASDDEGKSFARRYMARVSRSDDDVSDWMNSTGQLVFLGVVAAVFIWFLVSLVIG